MDKNDLIYRNDLLAAYDAAHKGPPGGARKLIAEAPAIDAAPVIRCKDCWKCGYDNCPMNDYFDSHPMEPDFYCAYGEPEEMRPHSTCGPDFCEIGGDT